MKRMLSELYKKVKHGLLEQRKVRLFSRIDLIVIIVLLALFTVHLGLSSFVNPPDAVAKTHDTCDPNIQICNLPNTDPVENRGSNGQFTRAGDERIVNPIANGLELVYLTDVKLTTEASPVKTLWSLSLTIVDIFIVLILAMEGLRIMLAGTVFRYANAIEAIPGILLALVAAHLSMAFMSIALSTNNTLSMGFRTVAIENATALDGNIEVKTDCGSGISRGWNSFWNGVNFLDDRGWAEGWNANCQEGNAAGEARNPQPEDMNSDALISPADAFSAMDKLMEFSLQVLGIMLLAQIIIRILMLNLYIILAPLGIASWALPGRSGQGLTRLWLQGFLSLALVQILQVIAICIGQLVIVGIGAAIQPTLYNFNTTTDNETLNKLDSDMFVLILRIALNWFTFRIPSLLGTAPMNSMVSFGQAIGQTASTGFTMSLATSQMLYGAGASALLSMK